MTETDLVVTIKIDETDFLILSPSPEYSTKVLLLIASNYLGCKGFQIYHVDNIKPPLRMSPTSRLMDHNTASFEIH